MCNFDFIEYKQVLNKVIFSDYQGDPSKDPGLDLRTRLRVDVEETPLRKVYKGG